jgi:hypothetical protein
VFNIGSELHANVPRLINKPKVCGNNCPEQPATGHYGLVRSCACSNVLSTCPIFHKIKGTKGTKAAAMNYSSSKKWSSYKWDYANYFEINRKTNQLHHSSWTSNTAEYKTALHCNVLPDELQIHRPHFACESPNYRNIKTNALELQGPRNLEFA